MTTTRQDVDPRIARTRRVVLDAAFALLVERGFGRATVEGISERCGVARSTIYRHWPRLNDLLLDAVRENVVPGDAPETGALRDDLIVSFGELATLLSSPTTGPLFSSIIAESARDPELAAVHARFSVERQAQIGVLLERGQEHGELPLDADVGQMVADICAAMFFRALFLHEPVDEQFVAHTVDRWLADPPRLVT